MSTSFSTCAETGRYTRQCATNGVVAVPAFLGLSRTHFSMMSNGNTVGTIIGGAYQGINANSGTSACWCWPLAMSKYFLEVPSSGNFCVGGFHQDSYGSSSYTIAGTQLYMNLVPMANVLGHTPMSRPCVLHFILVVLHNRGTQLLVAPG